MGMLRPIRRTVRWMAGGLVLSLLALGCATPMPVATAPKGPQSGPEGSEPLRVPLPALAPAAAPTDAKGVLTGQASLPEEMVDANHVIPTGIGRVIPTGQGRYRVQQAAAPNELPVTGALVTLRDVTTRQPIAGIAPVRTDARGAFSIAGVPTAGNVLIEIAFTLPGEKTAYHLLGVGRAAAGPEAGSSPVAVTWRSTAVVTRALSTQGTLDLLTVDPETLRAAELAEAERLSSLSEAQRKAALTETLAGALLGTLLPTPGPSPTPTSSQLPGLTPVSVPSVLGANASPLPGLVQPVTDVVTGTTTAAQGAVSDTAAAVENAVTNTTQGVVAPAVGAVTNTANQVVDTTLSLLPTPTPRPTTTPTPAPTATPKPLTLPIIGGVGL
jgi:hypothetical protein